MNPCRRCLDFGILRLKANGTGQEALCFCTCEWATKLTSHSWKLPRVNKKIEQAFEVSKCPLTWFLPDNERGSVPRGELITSLTPIAQKWRDRVREAEKFWAENGPLFEDGPKFWNEPDGGDAA